MFLPGLQTKPYPSSPYLIRWTSKFNIKKETFSQPLTPPFVVQGSVWVEEQRYDTWKHDWFLFKFTSYVGSDIWASHFSSEYHRNAMKTLYGWWFLLVSEGNKLVPAKFVIYIDTHCSNLHQHKPWVAGRPCGYVSAVSPYFMLQLRCTGF